MGVIASVSSTLSFGLTSGGHVGMVFGWLIPCLFVMPVAASMAELTSAMPSVNVFMHDNDSINRLSYKTERVPDCTTSPRNSRPRVGRRSRVGLQDGQMLPGK